MNRIILQLLAVGFCFAVGQALECYSCKIGVGNICITTKKTCKAGELCYSGVGTAATFLEIKKKGCLEEAMCNKTSETTLPESLSNTTIYTITKTCCEGNLCNAAPGLTSGLSLTLASIIALFMAKILV
ncbi:sperm acrosome membrane-associated protein 4 [Centropristis striata]|uniref:sperm acrosome membrane-associated protein 4 n=1 Tax=Centropristis striata TaxID=184440 RepID=UPI0027DEB1BA|nr:sperm acrosome membrane-associated protein 4 [Centropristis striata]XP_059205084.1 sperm acrosome membrane-associated protein 4 [Centropristis striata]